MNCPYNVKICTKCNKILIACEINFRKKKRGKYGLNSICKQCEKEYNINWKNNHKEEISEYNKIYHKQYREEHKEELSEKKKIYNKKNKKYHKEYHKQYREKHKEELKEYHKQYREKHKEELSEKKKIYNKKNPHIHFNSSSKRRQLEENQGRGITVEQWYEMFSFFDWCCAYSGEYLGGEDNKDRTIDHIIALDNEGLNEVWNCVPMYKPYNSSKKNKNMIEWYKNQEYFSEERLAKIYGWCEYAYEKWGDNNG